MRTDAISEIMYKYPNLITEETKISNIRKEWWDLLETFCSTVDYLSTETDFTIILTEIKGKEASLSVHYKLFKNSDFAGAPHSPSENLIHNIMNALVVQLEENTMKQSSNSRIDYGEQK